MYVFGHGNTLTRTYLRVENSGIYASQLSKPGPWSRISMKNSVAAKMLRDQDTVQREQVTMPVTMSFLLIYNYAWAYQWRDMFSRNSVKMKQLVMYNLNTLHCEYAFINFNLGTQLFRLATPSFLHLQWLNYHSDANNNSSSTNVVLLYLTF